MKRADAKVSLPRINFRLAAAQTGMVLVISLPESARKDACPARMGYHRSTGNAQSGAAYLEYSCRKTIKDIIAIMPAWPAGKPHCRGLSAAESN